MQVKAVIIGYPTKDNKPVFITFNMRLNTHYLLKVSQNI